jgi:hypothetical protein
MENINPAVASAEYAVRGELVLRAAALKEQLASKPGSLPFDKLLECNIGNPQAVGQKPLNFNRQVLALLCCPDLLDQPGTSSLFASDAIERAKEYLAAIPTGVGAYSESQGFKIVRDQVAEFIQNRDGGIPADPQNIFLTDGASKGVGFLLSLCLRGSTDGVLVPIPQYPLYSASLTLQGSELLGECGAPTPQHAPPPPLPPPPPPPLQVQVQVQVVVQPSVAAAAAISMRAHARAPVARLEWVDPPPVACVCDLPPDPPVSSPQATSSPRRTSGRCPCRNSRRSSMPPRPTASRRARWS